MGLLPRVQTFAKRQNSRLERMLAMWNDPRVLCYNDIDMPSEEEMSKASVFLKGPTSRSFLSEFNWRSDAHHYLRTYGYKGWIFVPEPRGQPNPGDFTEGGYMPKWESRRILAAEYKAAWIPRDGHELLGLNTNFEVGVIVGMILAGGLDPNRVFIGWPDTAQRMGLPRHYVQELAKCRRFETLEELCRAIASAQ